MAINAAMVLVGSHTDLVDTLATITTDPAPKFSPTPPPLAPVGQRLAIIPLQEKFWKSPFANHPQHIVWAPFCHRQRDRIQKTSSTIHIDSKRSESTLCDSPNSDSGSRLLCSAFSGLCRAVQGACAVQSWCRCRAMQGGAGSSRIRGFESWIRGLYPFNSEKSCVCGGNTQTNVWMYSSHSGT